MVTVLLVSHTAKPNGGDTSKSKRTVFFVHATLLSLFIFGSVSPDPHFPSGDNFGSHSAWVVGDSWMPWVPGRWSRRLEAKFLESEATSGRPASLCHLLERLQAFRGGKGFGTATAWLSLYLLKCDIPVVKAASCWGCRDGTRGRQTAVSSLLLLGAGAQTVRRRCV